jgi:hypothetical protein
LFLSLESETLLGVTMKTLKMILASGLFVSSASALAYDTTLIAEVVEVDAENQTITVIDLENGGVEKTFRYTDNAKASSDMRLTRQDKASLRKGQEIILELETQNASN